MGGVRTLNPLKPTFLKLRLNTGVVFLTPDQCKNVQMLKLMFEHIVTEEERGKADGDNTSDEMLVSLK